MNKAYDRVEWDFLKAVIGNMGFNDIWIQIVMQCVTIVDFGVLINGRPRRKFKPTRGLRQGDPLSPYLFLIVSEVLSLLIQNATELGYIDGIRVSGHGPCLSHLIFADDTLIFLKATKTNCTNIVKLLQTYCHILGQEVSLQKSTMYFSTNTPMSVLSELCDILNMPQVKNPGSYLGIPTLWGRSKKITLAYVKDRMMAKLNGWKQQFLSQAGKETLIKAIAQAVPTYPMNVFKLPNNLCRDIDAAIARFWRG